MLCMWLGSITNITDDWRIANGGSLSVMLYPELFSVIGYRYGGSGDRFYLPNLMTGDKFPKFGNSNVGCSDTGSIPNITGSFAYVAGDTNQFPCNVWNGAFIVYNQGSCTFSHCTQSGSPYIYSTVGYNASKSNTVYNRSDNKVVPQNITVIPIIKIQ